MLGEILSAIPNPVSLLDNGKGKILEDLAFKGGLLATELFAMQQDLCHLSHSPKMGCLKRHIKNWVCKMGAPEKVVANSHVSRIKQGHLRQKILISLQNSARYG